jgi:hypothetical protein
MSGELLQLDFKFGVSAADYEGAVTTWPRTSPRARPSMEDLAS